MNLIPTLSRADEGPEGTGSGAAGGHQRAHGPSAPLETELPRAGKHTTVLEARIGSLKILALSILREIESLEEQTTGDNAGSLDLQTEVHRFEAALIRSALIRTGGRQRRAARLLGTKVTTLNTKIKRYKIRLHEDTVEKDLPRGTTGSESVWSEANLISTWL